MVEVSIQTKVNSIKLTKLEKKVLAALSKGKPREEYQYHPEEGNDTRGIAELVFGKEVFHCERRGGQYCFNITLCYAAKSSLSRVLKSLWLKGLVKRCRPIYRYGWHKADEDLGPFYGKMRLMQFLRVVSIDEKGMFHLQELHFKQLPYRCRVWWMLTEKGKELAREVQ